MGCSIRSLIPAAVIAVVTGAHLSIPEVLAQPERQPGQPGPGGRRDGPGGPGGPGGFGSIGGSMKAMNRALKELKANVADTGKKDQNLMAVWIMERSCVAAKAGKPDHLEGDPAKLLDTYRRDQIKLMGLLLEVETAIMDGKTDAVESGLKKIIALRDESHKTFKVDEEEGGD